MEKNQIKGVLLPTSHYTKADTATTPKGTLMLHYALIEFGTPELKAEYEEKKGTYYREVEAGAHKDSPLHFTSQIFEGVEEGGEVIFTWNGERLSKFETLEERINKSSEKKALFASEKKAEIQMRKKAQLAKEFGLAVQL